MNDNYQFIRNNILFEDLDDNTCYELVKNSESKRYLKKEYLKFSGDSTFFFQ